MTDKTPHQKNGVWQKIIGLEQQVRTVFWPIFGKEHIKFLPLAFMMFFILFDYSMMRSLKDAMVVTEVGSEAIGFIKTYFVFPSAILLTLIYYSLCRAMDPKRVFYVIVGFFLLYFIVFTAYMFPYMDSLVLSDAWAQSVTASAPPLRWFIRVIQYWPHTTFYIISELFGSTMVSLFFWQLANQVTNPDEAKRHYSMFGLLGNVGLLGTSYAIDYALNKKAVPDFNLLFMMIIVGLVLITALYAFVQVQVETNPDLIKGVVKVKKKSKQKPSIGESIKVVFSSKYLGLLALLLICYGVSNVLIENVWKDRVKALYPSKAAYAAFMGNYQWYLGNMSIFFMLVGSNILRMVSWATAAILTPLMFLVTAALFFLFIFDSLAGNAALLSGLIGGAMVLQWAVMIGTAQNVLSKSTKYSLFDSTQKMAYMPLDDELKTRGMSAVEVIGGRFGKMGGGVINSTLLILLPAWSLMDLSPILAVLCGIIVVIWISSVFSLGKKYNFAMAKQAEQGA
ncbi:MAG: Npt1/Npt2 family nucleotide transporter [Pseudomonadota bacterium]|nr:Npt1/Npt2 family nucleotide transporter [Pseudomonadota bacterium]